MSEFSDECIEQVQVSQDGATVWVHAMDGSTVGRFSRQFGMDVHRTVTDQMAGASQCLHCTHERAGESEWLAFCILIQQHHSIQVDPSLIVFESEQERPKF